MDKKYKAYLKLNLVSLFFVAVSFISITLAWFAYSGLATVDTTVNVKAWHIDFDKDTDDTNNIIVSLSSIYPGMDTVTENVTIKNLGDSDAQLSYSIVSARILDGVYTIDENNSLESILDKISHDYPFHIDISLDRNYVLSKGDDGVFNVSISWPLDSGTDSFDSLWGNKAYDFQDNEQKLNAIDSSYVIRPTIKIEISLNAQQLLENPESSDVNYNLGDLVMYDIKNDRPCDTMTGTDCIRTNIIDFNSKKGERSITLLPDLDIDFSTGPYSNFSSLLASNASGWNVTTRALTTADLLTIVSNDVTNSLLVRENISDSVMGYQGYSGRIEREISELKTYNGYYTFQNPKFIYFSTGNCYWTSDSYDSNRGIAFKRIDLNTSKIYGEDKLTECGVVPVIIASKTE